MTLRATVLVHVECDCGSGADVHARLVTIDRSGLALSDIMTVDGDDVERLLREVYGWAHAGPQTGLVCAACARRALKAAARCGS